MNPPARSTPQSPVQLVLTAPPPYGSTLLYRTRALATLGVLTQLFHDAQGHIVLATPYIGQSGGLIGPELSAACRVALARGVRVSILSTGEGLRSLGPWRSAFALPLRERLGFFRPTANVEDPQRLGSHAKFCLCDRDAAYIGSANFTGPGLGGHLEMGVLVRGGVAQQMEDFWSYAVEQSLFVAQT